MIELRSNSIIVEKFDISDFFYVLSSSNISYSIGSSNLVEKDESICKT